MQTVRIGDLRSLTDEQLDDHLANVAGTTGASLHGAYLEIARRAQRRMEESQLRVEASQERAEALTAETVRGTATLVRLTWAIMILTVVNVSVFVYSLVT